MLNICAKEKSDEEALKYREIGNKHFQEKDWFNSLYNYNASITFAKSKAVASLGYGNRSAVYMEIGRFEDCMKNIQWALENEYPEDKLPRLLERKEKCEKMMKDMKLSTIDPWDIFQLSHPANEKIPWLVDCVEVRRTEKDGRGIYAKQVLKAGDIICIEEPPFNYSNEKGRYMRCYNCSKACALNLIPCDQTASMMFCSVACKENFYLKAFNINKIASADIKLLADIAAVSKSVQNVDDIIKNMDLKELNKTIFDFDLSDPNDPEYKQKLMTCLLSLSTNSDLVKDTCHIREYVSEKTAQHILSIFNLNRKDSNYIFEVLDENVGFHISLFASLINHSCYSNAFCITLDNKVFTIIHKPVRRGEQITVKYMDEVDTKGMGSILRSIQGSKDENVKYIEKMHKFKCECDLCAHKELMNSMFHQGLLETEYDLFTPTPAFLAAQTGNPEVLKGFFKKVWKDINRDPTWPKIFFSNYINAFNFLKAASAYLTYPFLKI
jgi:hypothetical protein